jgi:hypothetical protein
MLVTPITIIAKPCKNAPRPQVGDIDIVTEEKESVDGFKFYSLERFGKDLFYWSELFAILPEPSADDMAEADKEAIVNLETVQYEQ